MRTIQPLILCAILLLSCYPVYQVGADSVEVCCDSGPIELHLIGPAASGTLSPFDSSLLAESEEVTISDAIAQEREIATWSINPAWAGNYPSSTWAFSIEYEVENAGGAQINASVTVDIGGDTFVGTTDQSNSFLPSGTGSLAIDVNVEAGSIPSSTAVTVTLTAQTIVFSVPGAEAGLTFIWGGDGDDSTITAEIPLVDLLVDEPTTEGMDVYISVIVASPFGQMAAAHANSLEVRVNSGMVTGDPIETSSGDFVRLTWTWRATTEGVHNITVEASIQLQAGTPMMSGLTEFMIDTYDDGNSDGGVYYPTEAPLRTDGAGSHLSVAMDMNLNLTEGHLVLERTIQLNIDDEIAYWMRWGMDNIGSDDASLPQPLRIFKPGLVTEDDRRNRIIDDVERNEFENQMFSLAVTYMGDGMAIKLDELVGNDVHNLEYIDFKIDLQGENRVIPHPLTLTIYTQEILEQNRTELVRNFVIVQPVPIWSAFDLSISIETGIMSSLTGTTLSPSDNPLDFTQRRTPFGESFEIEATGLEPGEKFTLSAMPSNNPLNAPLSLTMISSAIIIGGLWFALRLTKNKRRGALWIEAGMLVPVVFLALYLAYEPFIVGVLAASTVIMWLITAIASPRRKGENIADTIRSVFPIIDCPVCSTPNPVTSDERPFRFPCGGCSRPLRVVD
ncbi:MAG: hypothetical protein HOM47_01740 [Euryarchaeota archaeon]|nr:hypothetical protein [Euryarchaeota archaeon]